MASPYLGIFLTESFQNGDAIFMYILFTLEDSYGKLNTVKIGLLCRKMRGDEA